MKGLGFVFPGDCAGEVGGGGESVGLMVEFFAGFKIGFESVDGELTGKGEPVLGKVSYCPHIYETYRFGKVVQEFQV